MAQVKEADPGIKCFEPFIPSSAQCSQYKCKPLLIFYIWVFLLGMLALEGRYSLYIPALFTHLCFQEAQHS